MKNIFKSVFLGVVIITPLLLTSCLDYNDAPDRTAADEQQELDEVLAKLTSKNYDVDTTLLGSYYLTYKTGSGVYPKAGDTIKVIYTGFFLNGTIFDASYANSSTDSTWKFVYKSINLIQGFDEALAMLNKGAEADFIIPSRLAYGPNGYSSIPAYTPLVFNLKMRDIKPKN